MTSTIPPAASSRAPLMITKAVEVSFFSFFIALCIFKGILEVKIENNILWAKIAQHTIVPLLLAILAIPGGLAAVFRCVLAGIEYARGSYCRSQIGAMLIVQTPFYLMIASGLSLAYGADGSTIALESFFTNIAPEAEITLNEASKEILVYFLG